MLDKITAAKVKFKGLLGVNLKTEFEKGGLSRLSYKYSFPGVFVFLTPVEITVKSTESTLDKFL